MSTIFKDEVNSHIQKDHSYEFDIVLGSFYCCTCDITIHPEKKEEEG